MTKFVLAAVLALLASSIALADDKAALKALAGRWAVAKVEIEGNNTTETFKDVVLTIEKDQYSVTLGGMTDKGTVKLDASKKLPEMDISGVEGPNRGKTFLCVYELKDDTLTVCYGLDFKTRPAELKTGEKSNRMIIVYKRKK